MGIPKQEIISYPLRTKEGRRRKGGGVDVEAKEVRKGKKNKLGLQVHRGPMPLERVAGVVDWGWCKGGWGKYRGPVEEEGG